MTINQAFAIRVRALLKEKKMTRYRLEKETGLYPSTVNCIFNNVYKSCNFKSMALIIRALGMSVTEFFDDPVFDFDNMDIDQ